MGVLNPIGTEISMCLVDMTDLYQSSLTFSSSDSPTPPATSSLPVNQVHAGLRRLSDSSFTRGKLFERVMIKYFLQAPLYREKLKNVQLWEDWAHEHGIDGRDVGIDLVAVSMNTIEIVNNLPELDLVK